MTTNFSINIAIIGAVSVGKSTLLNSLFVEHYAEMKIKRNTMCPQVYIETNDVTVNPTLIKEKNQQIDNYLISKTEKSEKLTLDDIKELLYEVPKVYNFIKLPKPIHLRIYDIPGLNDSRTKTVYFNYITKNIHKFDIIIFIVDVNTAFNTMDEINILEMLLTNMKKCKDNYKLENNLIIVVNKCDNMYLSNLQLKLDDEYSNMLQQVQITIDSKIKEIYPSLKYYVIPISGEQSFIYRYFKRYPNLEMDQKYINNIGCLQWGKIEWNKLSDADKKARLYDFLEKDDHDVRMELTGFNRLKCVFHELLSEKGQYDFLMNKPIYSYYDDIDNGSGNNFSHLLTKLNSLSDCLKNTTVINKYFYNKYNLHGFTEIIIKDVIDLMNDFNEYIASNYMKCIPKNAIAYRRYQYFSSVYDKIKEDFIDVWNLNPNNLIYHRQITLRINGYCLESIKNTDINNALLLVDQLKNNNYSDWKNILLQYLTNNIPSNDKNRALKYLYEFKIKYDLTDMDIIDISLRLIYLHYKEKISSSDSTSIGYLLEADKLWCGVIISSDNTFSNIIHLIKTQFKDIDYGYYSLDKLCGNIITYDLESDKQIIANLKNIFPNDIHIFDELIKKFKQSSAIVINNLLDLDTFTT